jgi:hypothetical protein
MLAGEMVLNKRKAELSSKSFCSFIYAVDVHNPQVVWTNGATNCLHTDIDADAVKSLRALIHTQHSTCSELAASAAAAASAALTAVGDSAQHQPTPVAACRNALGSSSTSSQGRSAAPSSSAAAASAGSANSTEAPICSRTTSWLSPSVHAATAVPTAAAAAGSSGSNNSGWTIIPDTPSSSFLKWAGPLVDEGVRLFADLPDWLSQ